MEHTHRHEGASNWGNRWRELDDAPRADLRQDKKWHVLSVTARSSGRGCLALYDILNGLGYQVFLDQYVLTAADPLAYSLGEALDASQSAILVWSNRFEDSEWCKKEAGNLMSQQTYQGFYFVIAKLDDTPLTGLLEQLWVDFAASPKDRRAPTCSRCFSVCRLCRSRRTR